MLIKLLNANTPNKLFIHVDEGNNLPLFEELKLLSNCCFCLAK